MRWRRERPAPDVTAPVTFVRQEISAERLTRKGWPRDLQTVRKVLPEHLHDSEPGGGARYGSWIVVAQAGGRPIGLAWTIHSAGDSHGAYIEEVAVLESHQGLGIGVALLRETARWMVELGRPNLSILPMTGSGWVVRAGFGHAGGGTYTADAHSVAALPNPGER